MTRKHISNTSATIKLLLGLLAVAGHVVQTMHGFPMDNTCALVAVGLVVSGSEGIVKSFSGV